MWKRQQNLGLQIIDYLQNTIDIPGIICKLGHAMGLCNDAINYHQKKSWYGVSHSQYKDAVLPI